MTEMETKTTSTETGEILDISKRHVDVEKAIRDKNPKVAKRLPKFVYRYLRRVIHEKRINEIFYKHRDKPGLPFLDVSLNDELGVLINARGLDNIPESGRCIVAANHPLGGIDGMALMHVLGQKFDDIKFPVNDILMGVPQLKSLFVPINKMRNRNKKENINRVNEMFASDAIIPYFPAGLVSRKKWFSKEIKDLEWKKSVLIGAQEHNRLIVPTHIDGRNSNFFYRLANYRKLFGIKANIEMLYLVDEMMKQKNKHINITFGKPLPPETFDRRIHDLKKWVDILKEHVYELEKNPEASFEDVAAKYAK